jgi:hypothetical protein
MSLFFASPGFPQFFFVFPTPVRGEETKEKGEREREKKTGMFFFQTVMFTWLGVIMGEKGGGRKPTHLYSHKPLALG